MQPNDTRSYPGLLENKVEGWRFLNGNVAREEDLVRMCRDTLLNPRHSDERLNESKKVLLVTAAFSKGHEHKDRHLIEMFEQISIDAKWDGAFPSNIQNLSVYSMFNQFRHRERWLYQKYTEKQDRIEAIKQDYLGKNLLYVRKVYTLTGRLQADFPHLSLYDFYYFQHYRVNPEFFAANLGVVEKEHKHQEFERLWASPSSLNLCAELYQTLEHIMYKDNELFSLCQHIERYYLEKSGVQKSAFYQEQRAELGQRILSSASIMIFGGRVFVLVNRLRFYCLEEFFKEAVQRGTNVYGISAGSICQTDSFALTIENSTTGGHTSASDYGMGLVRGLWIFPHAEDLQYIREADRDKLSYFALRHRPGVAVGLTEKSVLLYERYRDPYDALVYSRYTSVGDEPVLVFGEKGIRCDLHQGDQIILDGTKFYQGKNQVATKEEIRALETAYLASLPEITTPPIA